MKLIGLLGGTSWPSTLHYYSLLNQMAHARFGGRHSANLLLRSIDYHDICTHYESDWNEVITRLKAELILLLSYNPDCILICNNTLHRAYDAIRDDLPKAIPFIHIAEETLRYIDRQNHKNILLLGTKQTMENGYYAEILSRNGATIIVPDEEARVKLQLTQTYVATYGKILPEHTMFFSELLKSYAHLDAAVLACTELPLLVETDRDYMLKIINPSQVQCEAAMRFACDE